MSMNPPPDPWQDILARLTLLERENADLRAQLLDSKQDSRTTDMPVDTGPHTGPIDQPERHGDRARPTRRHMLRTALGATVATVGADVLLERHLANAHTANAGHHDRRVDLHPHALDVGAHGLASAPGSPIPHRAGVRYPDRRDPAQPTASDATLPRGAVMPSGAPGHVDFDVTLTDLTGQGSATVAPMFWNSVTASWFQGQAHVVMANIPVALRVETHGRTVYLKVLAIDGADASFTALSTLL